jgi:hypothetical protein
MPHPLLEEGQYYGKLIDIGTDQLNTENRTPFVYVSWEVTHRAVDGKWQRIAPAHRESRWFTTEKAEPYTMDRLARLGFNGDFDKPAFTAEPNPQTDGVELSCRQTYRDNKAYEQWDLAGGQSRDREAWTPESKRLFKAKYKTRLASESKPSGLPPAPPAKRKPSSTAPIDDSEIPQETEPDGADVPDDEIPF